MSIKAPISGWTNSIKKSVKRFPIAILLSIVTVIVLISIEEGFRSSEELFRVPMTLILGIPISLCIDFSFENNTNSKDKFKYLCYIIAAICLISYGYLFLKDFNMVSMTRYLGLVIIFILGFFFVPYLKKAKDFEMYVIEILRRFFTTVIYSIVLFLGSIAILFAANYLLELKIDMPIYYYTWLIVVGVFAMCFFLSGIPEQGENLKIRNYPEVFKILLLYIVMPLISIYTIILYIYFGKIIITMQWPEGLVSHLVLWYGVISVITLFLIFPVQESNKWVNKFIKVFPKAILPLIILMFISIGIRINAYGITESRYFVLALGIWVFSSMLYYSISKKKKNLLLLVSLSIITFVSICGPLSSYNLSMSSQNKRFEKILVRNNMLQDDEIVKATSLVSVADQSDIISILEYFNVNHKLNDLKCLPDDFTISDTEKILGINRD